MRHRPLCGWAAAFVVGAALWTTGAAWVTVTVALTVAVACGLFFVGRRELSLACVLLLTGFGAGVLRGAAYGTAAPDDASRWATADGVPVQLTGRVAGEAQTGKWGGSSFTVRVDALTRAGQSCAASGCVYVSVSPNAALKTVPEDGDRLKITGTLSVPKGATNPGGFDWKQYLARRAVYAELRVKRPASVAAMGAAGANPFLRLAGGVRDTVNRAVHSQLPPTEAASLCGILIGERAALPPDLMADFVHTGTVHVLASAGLHVGILAFWLWLLFRRLTLPHKVSAALLILTLWLYALVCGGRPAVVRAVVMATVYFSASLFERDPDLPTSVSVAALFLTLLQPTLVLEPSFLLSFGTVATLAVLMPAWETLTRPLTEKRPKAVRWAAETVGLCVCAQLGSWPIVAAVYNQVSLTGTLANLLVVPTLFILIPVGAAGVALCGLWRPLAGVLLSFAGVGLRWVIFVVRGLGAGFVAVPSPPVVWIVLYYVLLLGGGWWLTRRGAGTRPRFDEEDG